MRVVALVLVVGGAVCPPTHLPNFGHEFTSGWDPYIHITVAWFLVS